MRRHVQLEIERSDFIGYTAIGEGGSGSRKLLTAIVPLMADAD